MLVMTAQPLNVSASIPTILEGMTISWSEEQSRKADAPIEVTDKGMSTYAKDVHRKNAELSRCTTEVGILTLVSCPQVSKAWYPAMV